MAVNRIEAAKGGPEDSKPVTNGNGGAHLSAPAPAPGGIKAWLPLLLNLILMPALAYAMITFLILPKLAAKPGGLVKGAPSGEDAKSDKHGESKGKDGGKLKSLAPLTGKVLVNVSGTSGSRYLLANLTLVGSGAGFKGLIEQNDAQLRDAAAGTLASKTISDLEKPGARNLIRAELISVFNNILGEGAVSEIYLTDFAIQ